MEVTTLQTHFVEQLRQFNFFERKGKTSEVIKRRQI